MTDAFWDALSDLRSHAAKETTAIMCSETLWWRCHRRLIADAAVARAVRVLHIMKPAVVAEHALSPGAHIVGDRVVYTEG